MRRVGPASLLLLMLPVAAFAQSSEQSYANSYREICNRYLALARRLSAEEIVLPKGANRKAKLAILAARQENDASRMKGIADALRRLRPPWRFATLQRKTQTFIDLNVSQPLEQARSLRRAILTGKRFSIDALSDRQNRELTKSAAAFGSEARRLGIKTAFP